MDINRFSSALQVVTLSSHTFLPHALGSRPVVIDLGANRGEFYRAFSVRFEASRYVAVEANPSLADGLRAIPGVFVLHCAVAGADGTARFKIDENPEASHLSEDVGGTVEVESRTLGSILAEADVSHVDLLKVDIEGAEFPMLMGASSEVLGKIKQITIEFHDFCGIGTPEQVRDTVQRLKERGFSGIRFSGNNTNWCFVRRGESAGSDVRFWVAKSITAPLRRMKHALLG